MHRDGWDMLLLCSLLLLHDVCQRLKLHREALLHSLELACLTASLAAPNSSSSRKSGTPAGDLSDPKQAVTMAAAALAAMLKGPVDKRSSIMKAGGAGSSPSGSPRLLEGQQAGQQQQQLGGNSSSPVAAAGSPSSPLGGGGGGGGVGSSSSSSTAWNYVVQHLDVAAALQQMPPKEEATQASVVTDLLLRCGCCSRTHCSVSPAPCAHVCPFGSKSMAQCLQVINRHCCISQCMKHGMTGITPRCRVRFYIFHNTLHALHPQLLTPVCTCKMLQVQPAGLWLVAHHHSSWRLHNTLARP
jgi:hypothetical protein